jgi:hypothetical protein
MTWLDQTSLRSIAHRIELALATRDRVELRRRYAEFRQAAKEAYKPRLIYTVGTEDNLNRQKLAGVPTAYVGPTMEDARRSCIGCPWFRNGCNAHEGRRIAVLGKIEMGNAGDTLMEAVFKAPDAKRIRISAIGDVGGPNTVARAEVHSDVEKARSLGLGVLGFTHFWREERNADLRPNFMASCEAALGKTDLESADEALDAGWRPALVLSPQTAKPLLDPPTGDPRKGSSIVTPRGRRLLVCPFETFGRGCNECGLCDPQHQVWKRGKIHGIAFLQG